MKEFTTLTTDDLQRSPFTMIGKQWMAVTAEHEGRTNAMTASWGGLGIMWGKPVAFIVVRKQRFTKTLIDASDTFSLSFFDHQKYSKALGYLGSISGFQEDKIAGSGLTIQRAKDTPFFEEASTVMICRKLNAQPIEPETFIDPTILDRWYDEEAEDYHTLYFGEVVEILEEK